MKIILFQFISLLILVTQSYCNQYEISENKSSPPPQGYNHVMKTLKTLKLDSDLVIDSDENIDAILALMKPLFQNKEIIKMGLNVIIEVDHQFILKPSSRGQGKILLPKGTDYYTAICLLLGTNGHWVWYYDTKKQSLVFIRIIQALLNERAGFYKNKAKPMLMPSNTLDSQPNTYNESTPKQSISKEGTVIETPADKSQK